MGSEGKPWVKTDPDPTPRFFFVIHILFPFFMWVFRSVGHMWLKNGDQLSFQWIFQHHFPIS